MVHTDVGLYRGLCLCHRNGTDLVRHMYQNVCFISMEQLSSLVFGSCLLQLSIM
jgi:hypothetical protein